MRRICLGAAMMAQCFIVMTLPALGRGETMPPPWGAGVGNAGDWLGNGPVFGFDDGPDGGIGGGPGGGWGGSWFEGGPWGPRRGGWGNSGGGRERGGSGGANGSIDSSDAGGGYATACQRPAIVTGGPAPCEDVCHCSLVWYGSEKPKFGTIAAGECELIPGATVNASCARIGDGCSDIVWFPD